MITIVDCGSGNLRSVQKSFEHLGHDAKISGSPDEVAAADRLVLPGVGAFGACMSAMRQSGLDDAVRDFVASGRPFFGICVGCQTLFEVGEELGAWTGLGLLPGRVIGFDRTSIKTPQMGWNDIRNLEPTMFAGVPEGSYVYFVHSFYPSPENVAIVAARCDYGVTFCAAVESENIWATQFHPEKSGEVGLRILANFANRT